MEARLYFIEKREGFFGRFFGISQSGSNMRTEILAGITTFITVAYILILNPQVLSDPFVITGDMAMAAKVSNGVFIGTCIGAFIGTFLCAVYAKVPLAQAPGMGYTYNQTLTIVFLSGVLFIVIAAVGLRQAIIRAIPEAIKIAITPGIGLFITIIGLKNAGIVVSNLATLVSMVDFAQWRNGENTELICGALVALFGLIDENGEVIHMQEALMADAISTAAGALMGTSTVTTVVESSAGIAEGGRTGMTSFVTSLAFLAAIILAPVVSIVPAAATAPALIFVGVLMLGNIKDVDFSETTDAVASFCTIVFMPFTYSIANGMAMGLITYCLLKVFTNKAKDVKPLTAIIAVVFVFRYAFMTLG